jgi:hypothetical protein
MKTNVFKIVLPMAVVALGLAGAASTNVMAKNKAAFSIPGYKQVNTPEKCSYVQECSGDGNYDCFAPDNVTQLYNKIGSNCNVPLKRNTP